MVFGYAFRHISVLSSAHLTLSHCRELLLPRWIDWKYDGSESEKLIEGTNRDTTQVT